MSPDERFRGLFTRNYRSLLVYAMRRAPTRADAEDAVADAFTVAWRRIAEVPRDEQEQRLWLYGVARRTLANRRRSTERADRLRLRLVPDVTDVPAADRGFEGSEDVELAMWALEQLSEGDREVVRLAVWEELTHAQIAAVIGTSVPNVAVRLHRARKRLKRILDGHLQGPTDGGHGADARAIGSPRGRRARGSDG